jgi:hypothetical protein
MIYLCTLSNKLSNQHVLYDAKTDIVYSTNIIHYDEYYNKHSFFGSDMVNYGRLSMFDDVHYLSRIPCMNARIYGVVYYHGVLIYPPTYGKMLIKDILNNYVLEKILDTI